jgi:hypothetical protein
MNLLQMEAEITEAERLHFGSTHKGAWYDCRRSPSVGNHVGLDAAAGSVAKGFKTKHYGAADLSLVSLEKQTLTIRTGKSFRIRPNSIHSIFICTKIRS